ncbi:MAG TPA: YihY/virulence factor BrkB family protein [Sphingomonadaceae bacterium]|nr:YihY/virulence factor BrkB family protein [Sphingomonadaceae bacterium]
MQDISPHSPEARRKRLARARAYLGRQRERVRPGTYPFEVAKRVAIGVYNDGFIHAGNLAYLAILTLFPFFIVAAAVASLFGNTEGGLATVNAVFQTMPPDVANALAKPVNDVLEARSGNLLWFGAIVGLWTTGSFIETIRDIIRRAYGVTSGRPFWEYRLRAMGITILSVVLALLSFSLQFVLTGVEQFVDQLLPDQAQRATDFGFYRLIPAAMLFGSLYMLFYSLTPGRYRKHSQKWPGPLFVTVWWLSTTALLPVMLSSLGGYDLTYGGLAGVMIALIFFFVVGLGVVFGAELNAALAEVPEHLVEETKEAIEQGHEDI